MDPQQLVDLLFRFINADSWLESKRIVENNPVLLTPAADIALARMMNLYQDNEKAVRLLEEHRRLLARCRAKGLDAAFADRLQPTGVSSIPPELLNRLQTVRSEDDLRQLLAENPELLPVLQQRMQEDPRQMMSAAHRSRVAALQALIAVDSTDEALQIIGAYPIVLTDHALRTMQDSAQMMRSAGREDLARSAEQQLDLLQRMRELKDKSVARTVESAIQHLTMQLMETSSCEQINNLLDKYGDILLTDSLDKFLTDVIANIQRTANDDSSYLVQAHQTMLRYLRHNQSNHPVLSMVHQCFTSELSAASVRSQLEDEIANQRRKIPKLLSVLSLYIPHLCREHPKAEHNMWRLCLLIAEALDEFNVALKLGSTLIGHYSSKGDLVDVIPILERILDWARRADDLRAQLAMTTQLANAYKQNREVHLALESFEAGVALAQELGSLTFEEALIGDIGHIYSELLSQPEKGAEYHSRALEMSRHLGDKSGMAMRLNSLALDYRQLGELDKSITYSQEAISIVREIGEHKRVGNYLLILAETYNDADDIESALKCYAEAAEVFRAAGNRSGEREALANQARLSLPPEFRPLYSIAVQIKNGTLTLDEGLEMVQEQNRLGQITEDIVLTAYDHIVSLRKQDQPLGYILAALNYTIAKAKQFPRATQIKCSVALADFCADMGNHILAKELYESVLPDIHLVGSTFSEAAFFSNLGYTLLNMGEIKGAMLHISKARTLFAQEDRRSEANCLNRLGRCYLALHELDKAKECFEKGLERCPDQDLQGAILGNLSTTMLLSGGYEEAEQYGMEAVEIYRTYGMDNDLKVARARLQLLKNIKDAPEQERQAILQFIADEMTVGLVSVRDPRLKAKTQLFEAARLIDAGKWEEAESLLQEIIAISEVTGYDEHSIAALSTFASLRRIQNRPRDALVLFERLLEKTKSVFPGSHERAEAALCNEMGVVYGQLGDLSKAVECFKKGLDHARETKNRRKELLLLGNLEGAYRDLGQLDQSLSMLETGLKLARELKNEIEEVAFLGQTGTYYGEIGDAGKTIEYFQKAVDQSRRIGDSRQEGKWLDNLGIAFTKLGQVQDAVQCFQQALSLARETGYDDLTWRSLRSLALLEKEQDNLSSALDYYTQAIELLEDLRLRLPPGQHRRTFLRSKEKWYVYQGAINCCVGLGEKDLALEYSEKQRARNLAEQLQAIDLLPRNVPADLLEQFQTLYSEYAEQDAIFDLSSASMTLAGGDLDGALGQQLFLASMREKATPVYRRPDKFAVKRLLAKRDAVLEQIRHYDPAFVYANQAEIVDARTVCELLSQQPGSVVIEFNVGAQNSQVLLISDETLNATATKNQYVDVVTVPDFNLTALRSLLVGDRDEPGWLVAQMAYSRQPSSQMRELWFQVMDWTTNRLYQSLLMPILEHLADRKVQHAILVPHMELGVLPLHAALYTVDTARRYFLDDYEISYAPSCAVLYRCFQRLNQFSNGNGKDRLLAFSNPTQDLAFAEQEVAGISRLFSERTVLRGDKCNLQSFVQEASGCEYLHFAGHANYDIADPMNSALKLFGEEQDGKVVSQDFTLGEIFQDLRLPSSRLVTLSACETGISNVADFASEFVGLASGLMHAGAPGVVSSLWAVNDLSTGLLMEQFYRHLIQGSLTPTAALRKAELWLRDVTAGELAALFETERQKSDQERSISYEEASTAWRRFARMKPGACPFAHPFYWAAFTLNGV